ncbi:unnamed protein product, partial [Owenia fusiformis]
MSANLVEEVNRRSKGHADDHGHPLGARGEVRPALQFVHEVDPKNDICCDCGGVLEESMQTVCGHRVCERHIDDKLQKGKIYICPGGDKDCVEVNKENKHLLTFPDHFSRKHISTLLVYCSNKEQGCPEQIALKDLQDHNTKCDYTRVKCKNAGCDELIFAKSMEEHIKDECVFRIEICQKCNEPTPHALISDHLSNHCCEELITCPYKCGVEFKRKDIESHETSCTSKPNTCELRSLGCDFKGSRADLEKHESLSNREHLGLFAIKLENHSLESKTLEKRIEQMKNEKEIYEKEMKDLAHKMGKLVNQYSDMNSKVQNIQKAMANHCEKVISLEDKYTSFKSETESLRVDSMTNMEQRLLVLENKDERRPHSPGREGRASKDVVDNLKTQTRQLDRMVGLHDVRLAEVDLRLDCNDITSYDGHIIWKITGI